MDRIRGALLALALLATSSGCDPVSSLQNREYLSYLDGYGRRDAAAAVSAFNGLDAKRGEFRCQAELEAARRASLREKAGRIPAERTAEVQGFEACLRAFFASSGLEQGLIQTKVVPQWVNHNFLPEIERRLESEEAAVRSRIDAAGCGGETCSSLTVVSDLAALRASEERPVEWATARQACAETGVGGLRPFRLPTKAELVALRRSGSLASDDGLTIAWSADRAFGERGEVLAWTVDFALPSAAPAEPEAALQPLARSGRPPRARLRCVHDLAAPASPTEGGAVDEMEQALVDAGCPGGPDWFGSIRLRDGLLVTFEQVGRLDEPLERTCADLSWCGLSWRAPSPAEAARLSADPWFAGAADRRCVATPAEP